MDSPWRRRDVMTATLAAATAGLAGCLSSSDGTDWDPDESIAVDEVTQYSAPGCNCCGEYASYLREHVEGSVTETVPEDLDAVKRDNGVPADLESCHTVLLDGYVVEGHVPAEAVRTLVESEPTIDGIALPGMPSGSPGMPGAVDGDLTVYAIGGGRTGQPFGTY